MNFGEELAQLRRQRRLSQLTLAGLSGVSQRHISFLEGGRAKPGPQSVGKLAGALELSYAEANSLYSSAGLAGPRAVFDFSDAEFEPAKRAINQLLEKHEPYPGVAMLRGGDIIQANESFTAALNWAFDGKTPWRSGEADNLFELTLHPLGLPRFMINPQEIIPHTLRRLRMAAAVDDGAKRILSWARAAPKLQSYMCVSECAVAATSSVLIERYRVRGQPLNLVSMVASFGSPEDVTAQSVQIELFYPDDEETRETLLSMR
ncbi:MAG: helix-turn-helix domain-containing protein [Pseudomonadota bacterium]